MQSPAPTIIAVIVFALVALVAMQGITVVDPGTVGVVTHFGSVQENALQPGLHFKVPVMTKVIELDTRVQKVEAEATASSKDLQIVRSSVALNYAIEPAQAAKLFSDLGMEFVSRIVEPAIQESIKATTSKYTAEELITLRAEVKEAVQKDLAARLTKSDIRVTEFSILDFNFSDEFNRAIEEKQVAEQAALRAKNDLERVKMEAQQVQAEAEGKAQAELARARAEAEAQQMLRETISAELLQLRAIERWDGVLPVYSGGDSPAPFLAIPAAKP